LRRGAVAPSSGGGCHHFRIVTILVDIVDIVEIIIIITIVVVVVIIIIITIIIVVVIQQPQLFVSWAVPITCITSSQYFKPPNQAEACLNA
jgi:uncharacterized membrane protein